MALTPSDANEHLGGARHGWRPPEASPHPLQPHHRRLRGHQKPAGDEVGLAALHCRSSAGPPTARISPSRSKSATYSQSASGLQSFKVSFAYHFVKTKEDDEVRGADQAAAVKVRNAIVACNVIEIDTAAIVRGREGVVVQRSRIGAARE